MENNPAFPDSAVSWRYHASMSAGPKDPTARQIGRNIKRLRKARGMTEPQLADIAGISSVKMIEAGRQPGRIGTLEKIAVALGVPLAEIVSGVGCAGETGPDAALGEFLRSPLAEGVGDREAEALRAVASWVPAPTIRTYMLGLEMLRSQRRGSPPLDPAQAPPLSAGSGGRKANGAK